MKFVYGQTEGPPPAAIEVPARTAGRLRVTLVDYRAGITEGDE